MRIFGLPALLGLIVLFFPNVPAMADFENYAFDDSHDDEERFLDDSGFGEGEALRPLKCTPATAKQKTSISQGNAKAAKFLRLCHKASGNSPWCRQLMRPNPSSRETFACTYGSNLPHQLIHPNEATWNNAFRAVLIIRDLQSLGVSVAQIYNWWRPEPYNSNVGGSKSRHPFGTSIDVRFSSLNDMAKAHKLLCQFRKQGRVRALGYYGSTGLHVGIGDTTPNTWGKACP